MPDIESRHPLSFLTQTHPRLFDISILLLRCSIGLILFVIGSGKVLGWFGGMGLVHTIKNFDKMGFSPFWITLSSFTEFIGGFLLIIGFITRPVAIPVIINMIVATKSMWSRGFFFGGAAYPFLVLVGVVIILLTGPMAYSIDSFIIGKSRSG